MDPMKQQASDSSLQIAKGDASAWRQVLARTLPQLYGMFIRRKIHPALAEELTQKTVFDAIKKRDTYDAAKGTCEQWLFTIAKNNLALEMRQRAIREKPDSDMLKYLEAIDTAPLPDEMLERKETAELVTAALSQIDDKLQAVLKGKYLQNLSARQIGKKMRLSEKAVHNLLYRGRIALKEKLIQLAPQFRQEQKI